MLGQPPWSVTVKLSLRGDQALVNGERRPRSELTETSRKVGGMQVCSWLKQGVSEGCSTVRRIEKNKLKRPLDSGVNQSLMIFVRFGK